MSKTLLRAVLTAAVLIAALPGAAFATSVDLNVYSMTGSPDPITLGTGNVTYTVTINNASTSAGTNVVLTNTLPASSTYVSATATNSGNCSQSAGTVTCSWASIAASNFYSATIVVTPTAGGALTLSSSVAGTETDPNTINNSASKAVTVNSQIDLGISSMTVSPDPITLGTGDVQFLVQFTNNSTSQATNPVLTSTIPASSTFVSATTPVGSGTCSQSAGTVTCNWASIGAGSTYYAFITVTPTAGGVLTLSSSVSATESDSNTSNNSGSKAVTVNSQIDLGITSMTVSPDPMTLGTGDAQFLVQFSNGSTSQATNVVLTSTIPVNSTFVSATTPVGSGSCTQSAGTVTCNWATIGPGSTYYAYITVTPTAAGSLSLASTVSAAQSDSNTSNNSGSKAVTVNSQIDLGISSMSVSPDPITLGTGDVQFFVQFTNNSTSQATNAVLTSTIPVNSTFVSATTPVGSGSCSQSAGTVTCNWPSIGASSSYYAYITVTPTAGGVLTLSSTVSATQSDSNTSDNSGSKAVTVNSQIDLGITSMTVSPDPITLGTGDVQFFVQYTNSSTSQATNVVLTSTIPASATFVSATTPVGSGSCTHSGTTVTCNWATIGAGSSYYAYITVTPTAAGSLSLTSTVSAAQSDPSTANNTASKAGTVNSDIDLSISSITGSPDPITLGSGNVLYTVFVNNNSGSQATSVVLTSTLPSNSTFVSATTPVGSGTCSQSSGIVTCNWASIGSGSTYYAYITVTPTANGIMTMSASVAGAQTDSNATNNSASKGVTVGTGGTGVDLQVYSVSATPDPITLNTGNVTYTVQVYNPSSTTSTNTVLTNTLPSNSTYVSSSAANGGSCSQSGGTVTCNWSSIPGGNLYSATIVVTPTAGGSMTLSANVSGTEADPNTANNSGSKSVTVNSQIDLQLYSISGTPDPITLNTGNVTYSVSIYNASTSQGTNTVLTNTLPANSTFVSATATNSGTCTQSAGTVTCNWPSIAASGFYTTTIVVTPTSGGSLTLSSSVSGTEADSNTANNTGNKSTTVNSQIDLRVYSMSGSPDPITLNTGNVTYTVNVYNSSTSQGTNTVLTNTLPANSTFISASATNSGTCSHSGSTVTCNWTSIPASGFYTATIVVTPTAGGSLTLSATVAGTESDPNTADNSGSKSVTVNSQIDLQLYSMSATPDPITLNTGNVTYTVNVYNNSTSQGTNTVLTNTLPTNSTFVSATATNSGTCTQSAGTVTCNWSSIPTTGFYTATIVVTPTSGGALTLSSSVSGTESDSNTANNTGNKSVTVNSQIDLQLYSISATPDPITLNTGNVTYTVNIYNASTSQGTSTVLTNTLPSNSTYVSSSATNSGTCTHSASTVTCNWTSIPASGFYTVTIVVTPTSGGPMTLASSVSGTETDPNTANSTGSKSVTVNSQIDLQVYSMSGAPDPITLNTGNVTYTVNVYNNSTSQGTNTVLANTLPTNSTFVSASATNSGSCTQSAGTVTCNWSSIPASGFYTVTIVVTPTAGGPLALSSSVSGTESDPNTANNNGNKSVTVNDQIDLKLYSASGSPNPITFGAGDVTFTVNVYNQSSSQGTNVVLTNTLPSNSTYVSSSASNSGTCSQSGSTVTCTWTSLPAFSLYSATIAVTPTIAGSLTLSASVSGTQTDPNTADNTGSATTTVNPTSCTAVPSGAVTWYRAENNGVDSAGPNFATANGSASYTTGEAGQAFSLNGTTAYMSAPDNTSLHLSALTLEGWFFLTGGSGVRTIVAKTAGASLSNSFVVYIAANGAIAAGYGDTSSLDAFSTSTFPTTNVWHHFAYTYDGTTQQLYLDGASAGSAAATPAIGYDTHPLLIGADIDNESATGFFPGRIDEVTIYGRALSAAEIQTVYGAGTFGKCYAAAAAPSITSFTPSSGSTGSSVVISGSNFTAVSAVTFNGTPATFTGNSSSQITAVVPATATTGTISVVAGGGTGTSASTFTIVTGVHWINSSGGNWSTGSNWSTGTVPTAANDVVIDAAGTYTVSLDINPNFNTLTVGGGTSGTQTLSIASSNTVTFNGASSVASNGAITFVSGTLTGSAGLTVNGAMNWTSDSEIDITVTVAAAGSINISGSGTRFLNGATINNSGTINWSGTNNISVYNSGVINNLSGGLFSVTSDQFIYQHCCGAGQAFNNAGTFRKTIATGTTSINNGGFNNSGTVDIQSGTFNPISGGTSTSVFNTASTGTFLFTNNSYTLGAGATLTGSGTFQVGGAQLNVSAAGVTVDHLTLSGGTLNISSGASVSPSASGVINWSSDSTLTGAGTLSINSGGTLNISGTGTRFIDGGTLNNSGTINWSGTNNISVYNAGVINNLAAGLFSVTNDQFIYQHCCGAGQAFNNAGTFRKTTATGTTSINNGAFNNSGTVNIQSGTFNPIAGGTSTSVFNTTSTGTFLFTNNSYTLGAGATLTGSGTFQVSGAQLIVSAAGITVDHLTLSGGILNISSGASVSPSASGIINWSSDSTLTGAGTLSINSGGTLNISGTGTRFIDGGTLNNSGTINWSGTDNISVFNSGVINNLSTGLFSVTNDQFIYQHCCTVGQAFNNAGTFRKTTATGTTSINNGGFNNSGTVDIQSGTFNPISGGTSTSVFNTTSAGTFLFTTSSYTLGAGATLTGSGTFQVSGAQLNVSAAGVTVDHLTLTGGTLNISSGASISPSASGVINWSGDSTLTGAGSLSINSGGTLNLSGAGTRFIDGGTLNNSGTVNWSGGNNISIYNAGVINNLSGGLFSVTNDQFIYQHCCSAGQAFNNAGTFRKTSATGTTSINNGGMNNSGTLQAYSGTIQFNSTYAASGSPVYDFGIGSATTYGRLLFNNSVSLTGALIAAPVNSFVPQGGQQYQIITFPTSSATFSPKTLTFGSSPTRSFADTYTTSAVTLTASGPSITTALSPNHGPAAGGTAVTITGSGFVSGGSLAVTFGGTAATAVTVVNASTITCTTPAHASGVVDVLLTNGDGQPTTATSAFTYDASPVITSIRPSSGSTAGAGGVIIDGTSLDTVTAVDFGGSAGSIIYSSATELTVAAPAHAAGTVNVAVTNPGGTYTLVNGFTYVNNDDAARDFFVSTNPSSRWSYGYEASRGASFVAYTIHGNSSGFDSWSAGSLPNLGRNSTASTLQQATNFTPSMKLEFHPGGSGENSVFRWTAPASGSYRIAGYFVGLDSTYPTTTDVAILHNNSTAQTLYSTTINSYNAPQNFDISNALNAGDTIEFTVGFGSNSNFQGDATGLDVTITPAVAANADIGISGSAPSTVANASNFTYTTVVTNNGPAAASNVTATITLPANVTANGVPSSTQGTCSGTTSITCSIGTLPASGNATQTINLTATAIGTAVLNASVTATESDSNSSNNTTSSSVAVGGTSSLIVTTNADSGTGSLRQAILDANTGSVCIAPCTISFNLPGGQLTITPATSLPAITATSVTIDATTQTGYSGTPLVTLDGSTNPNPSTGLELSGGHDAVEGLSIVSFEGAGITIDTSGNDIISGNYIGLHADGATPGANTGDGIFVTTANNAIGGTTAAARNVASGNLGSGIVLKGTSATANTVRGNYAGLNAAGTSNVANHTDGIEILTGASNNTIGGTTAGERNVISGNNNAGIAITCSPTNCIGNVISGNFIGTDAAGTASIGNAIGLHLGTSVTSNTIGGTAAGSGNTILSTTTGITFDGPGDANAFLGNTITGNSGMTIDLGNDGATANDAGDSDTGPNELQNKPVFVDAAIAGSTLTAHVNVDSASVANTAGLRVELFKSDASGIHTLAFVASQCFAGNALNGSAMTVNSPPVVAGDKLVATATSYTDGACSTIADGTSEVSPAVTITTCTPPAATITPGGPTTFCTGGNVTLTASSGASYQWRNFGTPIIGANAQQYVATSAGSYTVTITNIGGCSATSSATSVTVNNTVNVSISAGGPTTFCAGGNVTLTANPSGGSGTFASYQWSLNGSPIGGANASTYAATAAGSYTVTVADSAGCTGTSAPQSVTVNTPPSATINAPASTCANSAGNVASIASPVGGATYTWSLTNGTLTSGQGTSSITFSAGSASPISINVTASIGTCSTNGSATVAVGAFTPTITGSTSFCAGGSVTLTSSAGASYQWLLNGSPIGGANAQSYAASVTGNYSVTVTNGSCSGTSAPVAVTQSPSPTATVTPGGPTTFCSGGSVTLTSSVASTYQWLLNGISIGGANGQSINATATGNYSVSVTNGSGCGATSSPLTVTVNANPAVTITGPASACAGGTVTLDAGAGFASYAWSTGAITQTVSVSPASTTTYNVTVTNANGCSALASKTVTITSGNSNTAITAPSSVPVGSTGNTASVPAAQNGSTYAWTISGGNITSGNGTPAIVWTAGNGTTATVGITVTSGACTATGSATIDLTAVADLALTMTAAPSPVNAGSALTFTLNIVNNGPNPAQNVSVTNALTGVSAPTGAGSGWSCTTNNLSVVCSTALLLPGAAAPIAITSTAAAGGSAGDVANVFADTTDPNASDNNASANVSITGQPSCNNSAPALISPAAGATNLSNPVNFTWSAVANATSYDLWIANSGASPGIATTTQSASASISLPSGASTWYVAAHFAGNCPTLFSSPRDLTVAPSVNCAHAAPQLTAPAPNAVVNSPVTFSWTSVPQAVGYRLWIAIDGVAPQDAGTTNGATSFTIPLTGSSIAWHVDAIFPGCDPTSSVSSTFTIATPDACAGHSAPSLLAPAPNATLASSVVDFHWTPVTSANGYRVWTSINGADFAPAGTTASATTLHATFTSGIIAWYVEALFNGCASMSSAQQSFTIPPAQSCNNTAATPLAPANDVTLPNGTIDFSWSSAPNAIGYELWLSLNSGAPSLAGSTTGTTLRRTIGAGNIEWFVRAQFDRCDPVESSHAHFTFTPPADCDLTRPILTAPVDGAALVITPLDLRWSNVPGATQYKVWLASGDAPPAVIGTTAATHLDNQTVPAGAVSWSVEADFDNCPSVRSAASAFTAVPPPPPCSTPAVPLPRAESTASTNVQYLIRWTPVGPTATTQYDLQESTETSFAAPLSITTDSSEFAFTHVNNGDAPVTYYYRVRAVGTCNGARSLFSLPLNVQVLPANVTDPASANGSTPADNPQTTHYLIHLGGANGASHKGVIAAEAGDTFTATTNQPWLTVSPSTGTVAADGTTLTVTAKTDGLPVGTSSGAVNISFSSATGSSHLTTLDTKPTSSTTVSVNLVQPVAPNAKNAPPPDALIIPAVAHADGINSKFQSDVRVTNSSAQPMKYQVTFTPTGDSGITEGKQTTVDIDPGRTIALDDVLQSWFGSNGATGTMEIRPLTTTTTSTSTAAVQAAGLANILTFAASRTYNTTLNGTFGQYIPAVPFAAFVGRGADPSKSTILSLQQIAQSPAYRTNLGLVEGSGDPASVLISVFGDNGQKLTEFTQDLKGGQHIQLNSILAEKNVQVTDGRIEVKVTSAVGKVTAYASVLDNQTNDPLLVSPVAVNQTAAARYVIPGVADLRNGVANWQTDVRLFNPSTNVVKATMIFFSQNGGTPQSKDVSLAPGQVQTFDNALQQFFGISNDGGALHIATTATTPLVATARTYNQTANGTYGQFIPAVTANDAAALGTRPLQLLQIEESDRYRTNVGFAEVTGKAATIEVTAIPSDSKVAASTQINLTPNQFIQYPQLLKSMGLTNMYNARVTVKVISGQGRVTAYASVIDSKTNDPTFVPAQ
jgi:uncharacterized repeat protein (TIGR01451 family)